MSFFHDKGLLRGMEPIREFLSSFYPIATDEQMSQFLKCFSESNPNLFSEDGRQVISEDAIKLAFLEFV